MITKKVKQLAKELLEKALVERRGLFLSPDSLMETELRFGASVGTSRDSGRGK